MGNIESLLGHAALADASELLIMAGDIPAIRVGGKWVRLEYGRCTPADVEGLVKGFLSAGRWEELQSKREVEFEHVCAGVKTVCNVHFQRGSLVLLARRQGTPTR